jgi:hypothetical protein
VAIVFEKLRHHWKARRLVAKREKTFRSFEPSLKAAYDSDDMGALSEGLDEREFEVGQIDDEIDFLLTQYYRARADSLRLVSPSFSSTDGKWIQGKYSNKWRLSPEELVKLRSAVRKEEKERWELWQMRLTLLIGFGGMLIGLVSVLKR